MKVLTIKAFSFGKEKPIANRMAVVRDPDGITLRTLIAQKIKQADPSFLFSAVDHITQVVTTNDQTDVVELLDFPVSLLLGQLESMKKQPEISVTIDAAVPSDEDDESEGENNTPNDDNVESGENIVSNDDNDESKGGNSTSSDYNDESGGVSNTSNDDNDESGGVSNTSNGENDESGGVSNTRGNGENNASNNDDCDEPGEGGSNVTPMDVLEALVVKAFAERHAMNPQEPMKVNFDPTSQTKFLAVSVCGTNVMDSISVMTPISVSIWEPEVPVQDYENYQESSAPDIATLQNIVNDCVNAGNDEGAIDVVTPGLIQDNSLSISFDVPLFCLTTLWVLANKSEENKRKIIVDGATLDSIIEVMLIYRHMSVEIQTRACGLLWALSMEPKDRVYVAQSGGCDAILKAMSAYMENDALQVMALGALKVLSSSSHSKKAMDSKKTLSIVSDVMQKHVYNNPMIQSEGCVILGNLAVSDADQFVHTVSEKEITAVVNGILANPDELDVHEAACFTLMRLASSAANVELIRSNRTSRVSLEIAFEKNPDKVGNNILILLRRLKFDPPAIRWREIIHNE